MNASVAMSRVDPDTRLTLQELASELGSVHARVVGDPNIGVNGVFQDSRKVVEGALFAARSGAHQSGLSFWGAARANGAVALLRQAGSADDPGAPGLVVDDVRRALGLAAEALCGHPSRALALVGITGTNGKTTTAWLTQQCIQASGQRAGRLGTLGFHFGDDHVEGTLTTPEADDISRFLARAVAHGASHLVMEVSSHALSQARVDALCFEVAAFSNLTQDHLDYHRDMSAYGAAKRRLFGELEPRYRVVNIDDPFGRELAAEYPCLTVSSQGSADIHAENAKLSPAGIQALVHVRGRAFPLVTRLTGLFNLDNVLLALGIAECLELDIESALAVLEHTSGVPGRFERCDQVEDDVAVVVDYAHTPGALERVLLAARQLGGSRLVCVFGCGGDRDPLKRPEMGAIVGRLAQRAIVTNDNPRSEDPARIADAVARGLSAEGSSYEVILDRARAIESAIVGAQAGDVIVIAGKGHEPYQIVGDRTLAFDDRVEARRALAKRRGEAP